MKVLSFDVAIRNNAYSICEYTYVCADSDSQIEMAILAWGNIDLLQNQKTGEARTKQKVNAISVQRLLEFVLDGFDHLMTTTWQQHGPFDRIVIEQQPKCNPKMRSIAAAMYTFFDCHYRRNGIRPVIEFASPSRKLKLQVGEHQFESTPNRNQGQRYRDNKRRAKEMCQELIGHPCTIGDGGEIMVAYKQKTVQVVSTGQKPWRSFYASSKKKDDLSDCLLQSLCIAIAKQPKPRKRKRAATTTQSKLAQ